MDEIIIEGRDFSFLYKESENDGIYHFNFEIKQGEVILVTGDSGCGKSTFLKCINGLIPEVTEGEIKGELIAFGKEGLKIDELNHRIGSVFQNPRSQFFTTNTTAEIVFPMENYGYSVEKMQDTLQKIAEEFHISKLLDRDVLELSSGERQLLALASSKVLNPRLILFDEPSANLDYCNSMRLKRIIRTLKEKGITVLVADHRFFYLNEVIDRVFLIEQGHLRVFDNEEAFKTSGYNTRSFSLFDLDIPFRPLKKRDLVFELDSIGYKNILKNISLCLYRNEVVAILGNNGVGKTTLARLMSGLIKQTSGNMGKSDALYIMQDADFQLFGTSVWNELKISTEDENLIEQTLKLLHLYELRDKHPSSLSGGQKQRLQIGIAIVSRNPVIIFDEPTSGLDLSSMKRVAEQILEIKKDKSIVVISHDYEFIRRVSDKILYLKDGEIKEKFYLNLSTVHQLNKIFKDMEEE